MDLNSFIERLREVLPPFFTRKAVGKYLDGFLTPETLANLDCAGTGPGGIRVGQCIMYERENFLNWLVERIVTSPPKNLHYAGKHQKDKENSHV